MTKIRLDILLVDKGLFDSRERARRAVLAGQVSSSGRILDKPGITVDSEIEITLAYTSPYVSRGADKLIKALDTFGLDPSGRVALDAGSSTGGFTDVILARDAAAVVAVDVGYGQLAWKLRQDPRVTVFERTNIKALKPEELPAVPDFIVADLSFISLAKVVPNLILLSGAGSDFVFLIKPQFEAGKGKVGKGGIIREAQSHIDIITKVVSELDSLGLSLRGLTFSPIRGADGNIEFLGWFRREPVLSEVASSAAAQPPRNDVSRLIEDVVKEAHEAWEKK
jgi:23S rRNA (cytidine1920-2'-O)/16S rRNA (cytidine1409-2'-O)-methyltransferase